VRRRRVLAAAAAAVVVLVAVLLWPVGLLTGGDDKPSGSANSSDTPVSKKRQGSAVIARQKGKTQILVQAVGLKPSTQTSAYQVWLYDSQSKRKSLGATATDKKGQLQVIGALPADYKDWSFIDVTSVEVSGQGSNQKLNTGPSVLRGVLEMAKQPVVTGTGKNKATVLANIQLTPLPNSSG
jgi:anti-sigma-K factor RskA